MPNVQPIQQQETVAGALRNAAQIASMWGGEVFRNRPDTKQAFRDIARLLVHAIEGLSEPNLAAMQAGEILLKEWSGTPEPRRQLRDTIQGILTAQLSGVVPRTWEVS